MASYVYPAILKLCDDKTYFVRFPDLPSALTEGYTLDEAIYMAEDVLRIVIEDYYDRGEQLPMPSEIRNVQTESDEFASLIRVEVHNTKAVRKTVSLPQWMAEKAEENHISLSRTLQIALEEKLNA